MSRRFDNFSQRLASNPAPASPDLPDDEIDPENPADPKVTPAPETEPEEEPEMSTDTPVEQTEAYQAGLVAGKKEANDRMITVFASEHFAGREAKAAKYLGTDMSASQITTVLADLPAAKPVDEAAVTAAAEEAARQEMQENLQGRPNANLGADNSNDNDGKTGRAKSDAVWDKANAAVGRVKKEG